ncbi:MAG: bifunctional UDP-N-acetylglucosamine diphosphorylase/glucosamine-1-phosphate N-acetyltransferase GlmU [Erysipelotrichaceae bacterium]|jgi:bifunctional UDP-N-acetylglucosamine pyrophosphorylase/glucosamine-1-phosphate N-acetyltransferase
MISAIVMAAGRGTRMNSKHAKTMHKILGKPMIEHIYDVLESVGVDNKVFVVGYGRESIMNHLQDKVQYAVQQPLLGTAHAVMQAEQLKKYDGKTLIINGDCPLVKAETYKLLLEKTTVDNPLVLLTTVLEDPKSYGRVVREDNQLLKIIEKKDCNEKELEIKEINAGIYCVDNKLLWKYLPEVDNNNNQKEYYITDLVQIFRKHGHKVMPLLIEDSEELQGINSMSELSNATKWLQMKINAHWMDNGVNIIDPASTYISTETTIGQDTIIYPNVRIEGKSVIGQDNVLTEGTYLENVNIGDNNNIKASRITDSKVGNRVSIGPNSHLRDNCVIADESRIGNYVEMKNVIFGFNSKCAHLTYLGDTTVGEHCNFGCGVVTVNYDGKHKFHTEIGDHVFIGSNVNLIAPVTIGDYTVLAAGSTITADVNEGDLAIGRVRQEIKPGYGFKYLNK